MSDAEQREEALFEAALQLPACQRAAYLDQTCAGNAGLRRRVEVLLGAFERAGGFMKQPAAPERETRFSLPPTEKPGDRIGRYKLLEQIGEGGCGIVYVAEQEEPVRRRVALKVIKLGMDTKQVIARFDAERQALAMMDHPNIAKVFDAGTTETGRPYFVMELVRGIRITDYCDQNHFPARERLDLFIQVCRAIQHAHQKGVIHRDIKPSNILVTVNDGLPVPKVIDFGIAKATQGRLTDQTIYTAFEQFIGTPAYMSPEQAVMTSLDIDTRSDIYSLGVLLYELLTGKTPFDAKELMSKGLDEMRRTIREVEPVKPSTRLTQEVLGRKGRKGEKEKGGASLDTKSKSPFPLFSSAPFRSESHQVLHEQRKQIELLRGDLDWIVMKCLEKDRTRRYETANGLATDISRHLHDEPVVARPPSAFYQFRKSFRRNRVTFSAAAVILVSLVIGFGLSTWMFLREREARRIQVGLRKEAEAAHASEAVLRDRAEARARILRARILHDASRYDEAEKLLNEIPASLVGPDIMHAGLRRSLGWRHAKESRWQEAVANLAILVRLDELEENEISESAVLGPKPGSSVEHWDKWDIYKADMFDTTTLDYLLYGPALLELGDNVAYENFRRTAAARLVHTTNSIIAERICKASLLRPAPDSLMPPLGKLYEVAVSGQNEPGLSMEMKNWACISLAIFDYRRGNYSNTVEWCQLCLSSPRKNPPRTSTAQTILAMACDRLSRQAEARAQLEQARNTIEEAFQRGGTAYSDKPAYWFFDWIYARAVLREARTSIELSRAAVPSASK